MSEMEFKERVQDRVQERKKLYEDRAEGRVCLSCSHISNTEAVFCEDCGLKFESEEKPCPACGEILTGLYCEVCQAKSDGDICPSCGAVSYFPFCPECGKPVNREGEELLEPDPSAPAFKEMISDAEVEKIKEEMMADLTPETKKEVERCRQRIILQMEREYEAERDKRIEAYNASQGVKVKTVSPEEMAAVKRAIARLKAQVETETVRVDGVVKVREEEAERKRVEEEKQQAEEERKRLEEQKKKEMLEKINGSWLHTASWGYCLMKFTSNGTSIKGTTFLDCPKGQNLNKISGTFDGEKIKFYVSGCSGNECENHAIMKFTGMLTGSFMSGHMTFMKTVEHGIFIKNS